MSTLYMFSHAALAILLLVTSVKMLKVGKSFTKLTGRHDTGPLLDLRPFYPPSTVVRVFNTLSLAHRKDYARGLLGPDLSYPICYVPTLWALSLVVSVRCDTFVWLWMILPATVAGLADFMENKRLGAIFNSEVAPAPSQSWAACRFTSLKWCCLYLCFGAGFVVQILGMAMHYLKAFRS